MRHGENTQMIRTEQPRRDKRQERLMDRPDQALLAPELPKIAHAHMKIVQKSLEPGLWDQALRLGQRTFGCNWIEICTRNIRDVYGRDRIGELRNDKSYIVVSN